MFLKSKPYIVLNLQWAWRGASEPCQVHSPSQASPESVQVGRGAGRHPGVPLAYVSKLPQSKKTTEMQDLAKVNQSKHIRNENILPGAVHKEKGTQVSGSPSSGAGHGMLLAYAQGMHTTNPHTGKFLHMW